MGEGWGGGMRRERDRGGGKQGEGGRGSQPCSPGTTYWKGLALQMVTAGKSMVLKPRERDTLTSQLR